MKTTDLSVLPGGVRTPKPLPGYALAQLQVVEAPAGVATGLDQLAARLRQRAETCHGYLPIQPDLPAGPSGPAAVYPVAFALWRGVAELHAFVHVSGPELRRWRQESGVRTAPERVLWWVHEVPDLSVGLQRLEELRRFGPGPRAFTLRSPVPPPASLAPTQDSHANPSVLSENGTIQHGPSR